MSFESDQTVSISVNFPARKCEPLPPPKVEKVEKKIIPTVNNYIAEQQRLNKRVDLSSVHSYESTHKDSSKLLSLGRDSSISSLEIEEINVKNYKHL